MIISLLQSVTKAYLTPKDIIDTDWDNIAQRLMVFNRRTAKAYAPMFNLWSFDVNGEQGRKYIYINNEKTEDFNYIPKTIRRCKDNALGLWGLVLDCDSQLTIEQAIQQVDGLEYVLYTSFRHSAAQDKFRIVLPFTRMMTKLEFKAKMDDIKQCFPLVDNASFSESQPIYMHSGPDANLAIALRGRGAMLDPAMFKDAPVKQFTAPTSTIAAAPASSYTAAIKTSLQTCSNVSRSGANEGILLANICRSAGLSYFDFQQICLQVARADSSLRTDDVQQQFWALVGKDARVTKDVRDKFILDHNGTLPNLGIPPTTNIVLRNAMVPQRALLKQLF